MAYRQYIGARYVPLYAGDWDSTRNYEPLTIVTDANGNSYTSRKDVPAGTPLNDRDYWILTSSFSGAVEQLRRDLQTTQADVVTLQDGMQSVETAIDTISDSVANLSVDVAKKVNREQLQSITQRQFMFIGDSFGETYTSEGVTIVGWLDKIGAVLGITPEQMAGSFAASGMGFLAGNKAWLTTLNGKTPNDAVTDVVFVGGTNDHRYSDSEPENLKTAIRETISKARELYANAKIWVGYCTFNNAATIKDKTAITLQIYEQTASQMGASFITDLTYCIFNKALLRGNSHPNNDGTSIIAGALASCLLGGGYTHIIKQSKAQKVIDSISKATYTPDFYFSMTDNLIRLWTWDDTTRWRFGLVFGDGITNYTCDGNTPIVVCSLPDLPILNAETTKILGTVSGWANFTDGTNPSWLPCTVNFTIYNNYLEACVLCHNPGYVGGTLKQLSLLSTCFVIDALSNYNRPDAG